MAAAYDGPIHDNHFHCRRDGWKGLGAVREFMAAGGTSIAHVRLPTYPATVEDFTRSCLDHIAFGQTIRRETGCAVYTVLGPYPLEPMKVAEAKGWDAALEFGRQCFDVAARFCERGHAVCLGEVGRAHFDVPADVQDKNNDLLRYGMARARDAGVPVMLHTEHAEKETMAEFAAMADQAGLPRDRVIKHYCGPLVTDEETSGLVPSIIAGRSNLRAALQKLAARRPADDDDADAPKPWRASARFLMETDYIDEASRPNVVMPCDTVPRRTKGLMANGELSEAQAHEIHDVLPRRLYGG